MARSRSAQGRLERNKPKDLKSPSTTRTSDTDVLQQSAQQRGRLLGNRHPTSEKLGRSPERAELNRSGQGDRSFDALRENPEFNRRSEVQARDLDMVKETAQRRRALDQATPPQGQAREQKTTREQTSLEGLDLDPLQQRTPRERFREALDRVQWQKNESRSEAIDRLRGLDNESRLQESRPKKTKDREKTSDQKRAAFQTAVNLVEGINTEVGRLVQDAGGASEVGVGGGSGSGFGNYMRDRELEQERERADQQRAENTGSSKKYTDL